MAGGRPTGYTDTILKKAREYLSACQDSERGAGETLEPQAHGGALKRERKLKVKLPTKGGLASYLGVHRDTLYEWSGLHPEFSDIMEQLGAEQEDRLINNGLSGDYNPTIAKVLLTKHGYADKQEIDHTTKGDKIDGSDVVRELTLKLNELHRGASIPGDGGSSGPVGTETQNKE